MKNTKYIRSGNVVVTLHYDKDQRTHKVGYHNGGKRAFKGAGRNLKEAKAFAQKLADDIAKGLAPVLPFTVPGPIGHGSLPTHPMLVEDVVKDLLTLKGDLTTVPKAGGGIEEERLSSLKFAGRLLQLLYGGRYIHTITVAELKHHYAGLANGTLDLTPIYSPTAKNKGTAGEERNPVTVTTYFNRMNSFFVHARDLEALHPGDTACWQSLASRDLNKKTRQAPYTAEELAKLLPLMEQKAPELVRPTIFVIEGGRYCELAVEDPEPGATGFLYLTSGHIRFGTTIERNTLIKIDTGSIEIPALLAKKGLFEGKRRFIIMTPFGKRYFHKYRGYGEVIIPLRWRKRKGHWIQEPIHISRAISRFIDANFKFLGFKSRRNGFRHFAGSVRPLLHGARDSATSLGHSPKIGSAYYDHRVAPTEVLELDLIQPLPGDPLPPPPSVGACVKERDLGRRSTVRGGNVALLESGPLLMEFKQLYEQVCGTSHGWETRLSQLLDCSNSNVTTWWKTLQGEYDVERAPSKVYVDRLAALLADKVSLGSRLDLRAAALGATAVKIEKLQPLFERSGSTDTFALWIARHLPPIRSQVALDWIRGRRPASKTHASRLDALIERLEAQSGACV